MPAGSISMRKLKEILRLKYDRRCSHRQIAKNLSISPSTVSTYVNRALQLGLDTWPLPTEWDDIKLSKQFLQTTITPRTAISLPNWPEFHNQLKHKGVTKLLLWQEYSERHADNHYSYQQLCRIYKTWVGCQQPSMRQTHTFGEKLFIDYCGPTIALVNPDSGEVTTAQVFVAVMGGSNYTYAEATLSQQLEDWVMSHERAFRFFGALPAVVIPDNLRSGTSRACRYDPDLNPTYQQFAAHYNVAIMPARPLKPKDKSKAENGVLLVERWIMAVLRHETFYSLAQLNQRIRALLTRLNRKPFQKLEGCRESVYIAQELPQMRPLPRIPYQYTYIKKVRVNVDYHVDVNRHYYSVPHGLIRQQLEAHVTQDMVKLYHNNQCVAQHRRSGRIGGHTTKTEHMPVNHQAYAKWTPERIQGWARQLGEHVGQWVDYQLQSKAHPEQAFRVCLGALNLSKTYPAERLNAACQRAMATGGYRLQNLKAILKNNMDQQTMEPEQSDLLSEVTHENVRGANYFH